MKTKIELGVFTNPHHDHKDWLYQDIDQYPNVDIVCNANKLPLDDNSMDQVYASHIAEHFYWNELTDVLREWIRILKPKGELTVIVPDFLMVWETLLKDPSQTDWALAITANNADVPHSHRNHSPYYRYEDILKELGCQVEVERRQTWQVPEVVVKAIKV